VLAGEHAVELEFGDAAFSGGKIRAQRAHGIGVVFRLGELPELIGIGERAGQPIERLHDARQPGAFLAERLRLVGIAPDIGILELALDFR
jgi:hypothetical protein